MRMCVFAAVFFSVVHVKAVDLKNPGGVEWFDSEVGTYGWSLTFQNGKYAADYQGEGCGGHQGSYQVSGDKLILQTPPDVSCAPTGFPAGSKIICTFKKDNQSVYRDRYLDCGAGGKFWPMNAFPAAGSERNIDGLTVVVEGGRKGKASEDVVFRTKPDTKAPRISCQLMTDGHEAKARRSLPAGSSLLLLARTKEKVRVGKWTNYWYFVHPYLTWDDRCDGGRQDGWVFGEFVR